MARMLKIASLPLAAVAAAALLVAPASAAAKAKPRCSTAGKTLEATKDVRIYSRARSDGDPVYACAYKQGRKFQVGTFGECESGRYGDARFAGGFLAVRVTSCGEESSSSVVSVYSIAKRKEVHNVQSLGDNGSITDYVVAPSGAIAYITGDSSAKEVRKIEASAGNTFTTLDSGTDIVDDSLALDSQNNAYWRRGATVKSAPVG
jgi:hypothetical protein